MSESEGRYITAEEVMFGWKNVTSRDPLQGREPWTDEQVREEQTRRKAEWKRRDAEQQAEIDARLAAQLVVRECSDGFYVGDDLHAEGTSLKATADGMTILSEYEGGYCGDEIPFDWDSLNALLARVGKKVVGVSKEQGPMNDRRAHYELNGLSAVREHLRAAYAALENATPYETVTDGYAAIMREVSGVTRYANECAAEMETGMERTRL
jgi:hypothetical protein